jgi:UDP-2,4-diacetamido-2,4,6-trideoxy-beta-L-altropyranose hydrolase
MKVFFRTDASMQIGTGHVMRCLTLADALRIRGARCTFVCREHPGHLIDLIRTRGHAVHTLPLADVSSPNQSNAPHEHVAWLGADWATDAQQTLLAMHGVHADWLVVDHYALDACWESKLRVQCRNLLVLDDLADRPHDCDLLLDQNWLGDGPDMRYVGLVPDRCRMLLGPEHALLAPEYAQLRASMPERNGIIRRVLVFMGGGDPSNQTSKVLEALTHPALLSLAVDVVLGVNHPAPERVRKAVAERPATTLHQGITSLAGLMVHADLMIGAGGSTAWERMCLGLPAIVIGIALNQLEICRVLMAAGYVRFLGEMDTVTAVDITTAVLAGLGDRAGMQRQSLQCRRLVTGSGACDLATILVPEVLPNGAAAPC